MEMTIEELLAGIEGTTVEFKEEDSKEFYRSLAALANQQGGVVLLGISDAKEIVGFRSSDKSIKKLSDTIVNKLLIHPTITPISVGNHEIVRIDVKSSRTPIAFEGRYPTRVGNTTRDMLPEDLREFFLASIEWDAITNDVPIAEIDEPTVRAFLSEAQEKGRLSITDPGESIDAVLRRLGLICDGKLTNAAVLLFGTHPERYFPGATTRIGRFKTDTIITGDRWINGNLFVQLSKGEEAIKEFINLRIDISDESMQASFARREIWDYPLVALREALVNSLIHRDYLLQNQQTVIKVYDERIQFRNPGGLPNGLTVEHLLMEPQSMPRNPLLANVMYLAGSIERYGTGMARIIEAIDEANLPSPEFVDSPTGFKMTLWNDISESWLRGKGLSDREILAVLHVKEYGSISSSEYQNLVNRSKRTAYVELSHLVECGILRRVGETKPRTRYVLASGE